MAMLSKPLCETVPVPIIVQLHNSVVGRLLFAVQLDCNRTV
jgi:hypothetical protein